MQIDDLKKRYQQLKSEAEARMSGVEKAGQAFVNLAETQVNAASDLGDSLLQQLGFIYQEYKGTDMLDDPDVQDKKAQVAQKVLVLARGEIESKQDLTERKQRLAKIRKFAADPRFNALFGTTASTLATDLAVAEQLHVFALVNREQSPIQVTQTATGKAITLAPDGEQVFPLDHGDKAAFAFTSLRLDEDQKPDPYFLPQPVSLTPEPAGGSILEIRDHAAKTIPIAFAAEGITATYSKSEKGPWQAIKAGLQLVPGEYFARYQRADYQALVRPFSVKIEQPQTIVPVPAAERWQALPYLTALASAKSAANEKSFSNALAAAKAIDQSGIESETTKAELNSFIRELESHPVIVLGDQLTTATTQLDEFILSFVQLHDPINTSWGKPYRFQNGSLATPSYQLPVIPDGQLGLLPPEDAQRYQYLKAWEPVLKQADANAPDGVRSAAASMLAQFATSHPQAFSAEVASARAVFTRAAKEGPVGMQAASPRSYHHRWLAHSDFKKADLIACTKSLNSLSQFVDAGGKPNSTRSFANSNPIR